MKQVTSFMLLIAIALFSFSSCSKTRDGLGLDTIRNAARTGKWEVKHLVYVGTSSDPIVNESLTSGGGYAEFKSDKVWYYDENGVHNEADDVTYSFLDTKSIIYGGDEYDIQENLAGSFTRMTLQRTTTAGSTTTGREVYIFER